MCIFQVPELLLTSLPRVPADHSAEVDLCSVCLTFLGRRFVISLTALCCTRASVVSLAGAEALGLILLHGVASCTMPPMLACGCCPDFCRKSRRSAQQTTGQAWSCLACTGVVGRALMGV